MSSKSEKKEFTKPIFHDNDFAREITKINEYEKFVPLFIQYQILRKRMNSICDVFNGIMYELQYILANKLEFQFNNANMVGSTIELQDFDGLAINCEKCLKFTRVLKSKLVYNDFNQVLAYKVNDTREHLWRIKLKLMYHMKQLAFTLIPLFIYRAESDSIFCVLLRLCSIYNDAIKTDSKLSNAKSSQISSNTYPTMLQLPKRIDIKALLEAVAKVRAEYTCHSLISALLTHYTPCEDHIECDSEDSSIAIYKALTRHLTPPVNSLFADQLGIKIGELSSTKPPVNEEFLNPDPVQDKISTDDSELNHYFDRMNLEFTKNNKKFEDDPMKDTARVIDELVKEEEVTPGDMIKSAQVNAPNIFDKKFTEAKIGNLLQHYATNLWNEVGVFLEHVVLWWGSSPLASLPPGCSQQLREWLLQPKNRVLPKVVRGALRTFANALGCHVTATSWDLQFRLTLIGGNILDDCIKGTETGQMFADLLFNLVSLSNQCEQTDDFLHGAPLADLPLVEQIPILHRLDHSIHTMRLWAGRDTRRSANDWNVKFFFMVTQQDICLCLDQLGILRFPQAGVKVTIKPTDVHINVCYNLKEKLLSEIKVNIDKLKKTRQECIDVLASVCRTFSLANLTLLFPRSPGYWQKTKFELPVSSYVNEFLDRILLPVLETCDDLEILNLVLKIMCDAWLDHIYACQIRFSKWGVEQLLNDFGAVADWLRECSILSDEAKKQMTKNEVLRQCEGVGRLLLRKPNEFIDMTNKGNKTEDDEESLLPPEMFVPNQQQWLKLRVGKRHPPNCLNLFLCCVMTNIN
ncbi:uncharacterized protein LOC113370990 [Ctenocephalides felis]|uniref:uncharacterized protein LOC113370990 n=1 Tax=Ctenocephalides felis TaxID=7515 RepID=UPI000E6E351D|nr:uncharacterized protein LOC113370990 [Ctenocephalides felis]